MVFSRPWWSDTQPKNGRVSPLVKRSMVSASGSAAMPHTVICATPNSVANPAMFDTTINPEVDISVIITNISQKTGDRSIVTVSAPAPLSSVAAEGGGFSPSAATSPTTPKTTPKRSSVAW